MGCSFRAALATFLAINRPAALGFGFFGLAAARFVDRLRLRDRFFFWEDLLRLLDFCFEASFFLLEELLRLLDFCLAAFDLLNKISACFFFPVVARRLALRDLLPARFLEVALLRLRLLDFRAGFFLAEVDRFFRDPLRDLDFLAGVARPIIQIKIKNR